MDAPSKNNPFITVPTTSLLASNGIPIEAIKPSADKIARFNPVAMRYRMGLITHSVELPQEFEDEILLFPNGTDHDDMVDALTYAVAGVDSTLRQGWSRSSGAQWEKYAEGDDWEDESNTYQSI